MNNEPSHRRPPRQARWPNATPQEGWPATPVPGADRRGWATAGYRGQPGDQDSFGGSQDGAYRGYPQAEAADDFAGTGNGYAWPDHEYVGMTGGYADTRAGHPGALDGYPGTADGFDGGTSHPRNGSGYGDALDGYGDALDGYGGAPDGYGNALDGYGGVPDGYGNALDGYGRVPDGYSGVRDDVPGSADYLDLDQFAQPGSSGPLLRAPDSAGEPGWLPDRSEDSGREADRSGLIVGAVTGFLAAAVAIGVSTLAAAFVRPQAAPVIAVGGAFIDRTPAALESFAVEHFGKNDKTILLLGMYVTIALIAIAIGCLARREVTIGVAGIAAFGLFGAFVAMTRPESHLTDVVPSVIGGIAGIAAFLWLARAAAPVAPLRHARSGSSRRRAR